MYLCNQRSCDCWKATGPDMLLAFGYVLGLILQRFQSLPASGLLEHCIPNTQRNHSFLLIYRDISLHTIDPSSLEEMSI